MRSTVEPAEASLRALADIVQGRHLDASPDWRQVVEWGRRHAVPPFLFWRLQEQIKGQIDPGGNGGSQLPLTPDVWKALQRDYYSAEAQAALRQYELVQILKALAGAGVSVLLLKGAALAYMVYPHPALRSMSDLDLLVRPTDVERASTVLAALGYERRPEPLKRLNPFNTEFTGETVWASTASASSMIVELHWELFASDLFRHASALDLADLWARATPLQIADATVLALDVEDALAHVCLHIALHGFAHLKGYVDIAQIVQAVPIAWDVFVERASTSHIKVACYGSLWWAAQVWKVPVPDVVLQALCPGALRAKLSRWMVARGVRHGLGAGHTWEHAAWLSIVDRPGDLFRLVRWLFFPGLDWLQERYRLPSIRQAWIYAAFHFLLVLKEGLWSLGALIARLVVRPQGRR